MAQFSNIADGEYQIFSKATGLVVSRKLAEDKSLNPKGIFTLDAKPDADTIWTIESVGGGKYKLQARGAPVGPKEGLLWAFLTPNEQATAGEWIIQDVSYQGENSFIIVKPDLFSGWAAEVQDADKKQIKVQPLIVQPSFPPRYPDFEVFVIKHAN